MDCGWENPGWVVDSHIECLKSVASNWGCIRPAAPGQTTDMRDVPSLFAMILIEGGNQS